MPLRIALFPPDDLISTPHTWTAAQTFSADGIGATPTDRITLSNVTAAAAGAQQYSPAIRWTAQGWKTDATAESQAVDMRTYLVPVQGTNTPTAQLNTEVSIDGGDFTRIFRLQFAYLSSGAENVQIVLGSGETVTTSIHYIGTIAARAASVTGNFQATGLNIGALDLTSTDQVTKTEQSAGIEHDKTDYIAGAGAVQWNNVTTVVYRFPNAGTNVTLVDSHAMDIYGGDTHVGTVTNQIGLNFQDYTGATNNYGIMFLGTPNGGSIMTTGAVNITIGTNKTVQATLSAGLLTLTATDLVLEGIAGSYGILVDHEAAAVFGLALRDSSAIATGLSSAVAGTDVNTADYFAIERYQGAAGGARVVALAETTNSLHLLIETYGGDPTTTDTSASNGAMAFVVAQHGGANDLEDMAADSNGWSWAERVAAGTTLTRMLLKADDGELHLGNTTIADLAADSENDRLIIRAMQRMSARDIIETQWDNPFYDYDKLRQMGLAGEKDAEGFFLFPLQPRLTFHEGAIWQNYKDIRDLEGTLARYEQVMGAILDEQPALKGRLVSAGLLEGA